MAVKCTRCGRVTGASPGSIGLSLINECMSCKDMSYKELTMDKEMRALKEKVDKLEDIVKRIGAIV